MKAFFIFFIFIFFVGVFSFSTDDSTCDLQLKETEKDFLKIFTKLQELKKDFEQPIFTLEFILGLIIFNIICYFVIVRRPIE